ncbi:transcription factor E2F7 [Antennarius striatus]|uniref:transcription factor E2F7 n=1 Tax=Antennarius striatus TaxID=241820 RepID=UPI0035B3F2CD
MEVQCLALKDLTSPNRSFKAVPQEEDGGQSEQKENICIERRRSTPLKSAESTMPALLKNRKGATPDLAHITPIKHSSMVEPWTPTANLKMLISAASPDIRDREMKKVLFRPIENENNNPVSPPAAVGDMEVEDANQLEAVEEEEEDDADRKPSRKQKSLGLLCQKFLALYPDYPPPHCPIWISLDEVATSIGVERRRIYDIVNVLESLMIVGRIAKNSYTWYGRQQLEATLEELQQRGRQQGYHLQMELAKEGGPGREDDATEGDAGNAGSNRKDKSLRIMSQKFVMLFLVSKTQTVTLDAAAKILIEESQDTSSHSKYKTKVRRLYDIANVLTSLGLIKKVHVREERGRKPAFKWLGPVEFNQKAAAGTTANLPSANLPGITQPMADQDPRRAGVARHASFNIATTSGAVQRQVSSAPSSPRGDVSAALQQQPVDYSRRNNTVCRLQFGNSTDNRPAPPTHSCGGSPIPGYSTPPISMEPSATPSSSSSRHCLAYLPSLSQPSVVMLYAVPDQPDQTAEGQRSTGEESREARKRRREDGEEGGPVSRKKGALEEGGKTRAGAHEGTAGHSQPGSSRMSPHRPAGLCREQAFSRSPGSQKPVQPSHYLYIPNNAGLNSLNVLVSASQPPAGLPPSSLSSVALPYVLLPSSALSHYPLLPGGLPQPGSDAHHKLSFSLPTVVAPANFMVGALPYSLASASETGRSPVPSQPSPDHGRACRSSAATPHSPPGPRQTVPMDTPEPPTPHTPEETTPSASSKAFFQTPGALGAAAPAARKRGSAQRRLDVSHPLSKPLEM